ncbi:hypothetical protein [Nocardia alni]|uniref:hypothetical protein n=1 Tax=Nocardia alni TaxID=2815723 RepID=UPI001C21B825|nr:hypothetical protein [Nocardia alni]
MSETDPHIHVEQKVMQAGVDYRNLVVSILGKPIDPPSVVTTGCGVRVPYAMTSQRPESVTCLACRDHAHREHLRLADQLEQMSRMPGTAVPPDRAARAAQRLRNLAQRFSS